MRIKIQNRQVRRANSGFAGSLLSFPGNLRFLVLAQGRELSLSNRQVIGGLCSLEQKANCHHCDPPRVLVNLLGLKSRLVSYRGRWLMCASLSVHSADGPAASEESGTTEPDLPNPHVGEVSVPSSGGPRLQEPPQDCR